MVLAREFVATSWEEVISLGLKHWKKKTLQANIRRLVFGLWRNRNEIRHDGHSHTEEQLLQQIHWEVRAKLWPKGKFGYTARN